MVVVVDYGMGNLESILVKVKRLKQAAVVSARPDDIASAAKIILPGVGHFSAGMSNIGARGLTEVLKKRVVEDKTPILGICLGMQLFMENSEEGNCNGLGYIKGSVKRFGNISGFRVPHMGWDTISVKKESILLRGIPEGERFYFAHSFYAQYNKEYTSAATDYGLEFASIIEKDNIFGTQFHPEKSRLQGLRIIENFLRLG